MFRELNWSGILFGVGAGLVFGLIATIAISVFDGGTFFQVIIQFGAFFLAGWVAGRFSLVGSMLSGGFAALLLYFGLAVISVMGGTDIQPVAILFFGITAPVLGTAGAVLAEIGRRKAEKR